MSGKDNGGRRRRYVRAQEIHHPAAAPRRAVSTRLAVPLGLPPVAPRFRRWNRRPLLLGALAFALLLAAGAGIALWAAQPRPVSALQVLFDGRAIGFVADESVATSALDAITADLKNTYGMDIDTGQALTFTPLRCDKQLLCTKEQIAQAIKDNMNVKVVAAVIVVNDRPAVALHTQQEAQQALDSVLAPYRDAPKASQRNRSDVGFVESVNVTQISVDYSLVCAVGVASRTLALGAGVQDNYVEAQKGDSLSRIAKRYDLKVSDLRRANPSLAGSDVIQPGDRINAVKPTMWVNVRYTDTVTREDVLPFKTVEQTDDTLYTTQKSTKQAGKNGTAQTTSRITYINGIQADKEILSQDVLTPAQDQIVLRGTKKVPTNLGGGTSSNGGSNGGTSTSGFMLPVTSYRLTSTFRVRTLQGVTRWHYGVDLATPTGTPIYAAKAGTVTRAGAASGYGLLVEIDHGGGVRTRYGHCSRLLVKVGQQVKKGQIIALVGSTGHSTGPHCHFEIRINGTPVNPEKYVKVKH